ncbi:olfactory receptor 52D1-like [Hyperolius riggenbachi]|uniref:olfactory receptor 52D1-like n=1 Tax=Hyperolius riggenbachi TaxID=752182 RepID=UPI0035A3A346
MENGSSTSFVLLGLAEMESLRHFYCPIFTVIYLCILGLSILILSVVVTDHSLHEPMYVFICNLVLNGVFGSSSFFPKLLTDLWTSSETISRDKCLAQSMCIMVYGFCEVMTFTVMAYDRYLAVCHPLHYVNLMTNAKAVKLAVECFFVSFILNLIGVLLTMRLPLCGTQIKNIFCDNMAIFILACSDTSVNNIYGTVCTIVLLINALLTIAFTYVRIYIVCLRLSPESRHKALHTLLTHLINFSVFLVGFIFIFIRYRLGAKTLPASAHILLSIPSFLFPPLVNPLVFGIRTKALKSRMVYRLKTWTRIHNRFTV